MVFVKDDLAVIVTCFTEEGWTGTRIAKEFANMNWNYRGISRVLAKYRHIVTRALAYRPQERQRPVKRVTAWNPWPLTATDKAVQAEVQQLQDDKPSHNSQRQAACIIGVSRTLVQRMLSCGLHPGECEHPQWMSYDWQTRSTSTRFSITSCLEILLQSEYQSILFTETRNNNRQIILRKLCSV